MARSNKPLDEKKIVRQMSLVGIIGNVVLSAFKLFAGIVGRSGAMVSDSVHSFSDVFATLIAYLGVRASRNEADDEHPYGHERFECLAALALGVFLLATGITIGRVGVTNIIRGNYTELAVPGGIALAAAVLSIVVKEAMFHYTRHYARLLDSSAFMADAWHHRSDALSSVGSFVGIGGAMLGFPVMDSIASVLICLVILKVAFDTIRDGVKKMMDTSCSKETEQEMRDFVASQPQVRNVDLLKTRMFGSKIYVDLEIAVDGTMTLNEAHDISEQVHERVEEKYPSVKHIMIHVNPAV